ncbi:unnamed protein product [Auanema sp. JU1783]|nr:unnamed protein product [Auanema sp. JU1783]
MDMDDNATLINPIPVPTILLGDYIEMAALLIIIAIGLPSNIYILVKLLKELPRTHTDSVKGGFLVLKINLNISDIFLLTLACGKLIWLYTYRWAFGSIACRLYQYLSICSLYVSSNIVVCIALDRLKNVLTAHKPYRSHRRFNPVTMMTSIAWVFGAACALPQFFVFDTINLAPENPDGWYQCTDIWQINEVTGDQTSQSFLLNEGSKDIYNISHLLTVFWGPMIVLLICYVIIAMKLGVYSVGRINGQETVHEPCMSHTDHLTEDGESVGTKTSIRMSIKKFTLDKVRRPTNSTSCSSSSRVPIVQFQSSATASIYTTARPGWRKQMRNKIFRTTLLVVVTHMFFWFPYNALGLMNYINEQLYRDLSVHANVFKDMQFLITLINPFLYGFVS